jgi:hypothetical protein
MVVHDKASWHHEHRSYPAGLDRHQAYSYGGFFLAWLAERNMLSEEFLEDWGEMVEALKRRELTPGQAYEAVDGVLTSDMVSPKGQPFVHDWFESKTFDYYGLFEMVLGGQLSSPYLVTDSWENYTALALELNAIHEDWLANAE